MSDWKPLLQIVHVSDLHFCDNYDDKQKLIRERSYLRLRARELAERLDLGGWHEGTLGHDSVALDRFETFLRDFAASETDWFGGDEKPATWLVDTGDVTTFGDEHSIRRGMTHLERWRALLGGCEARLLYGNHDAWPGGQPGLVGNRKKNGERQKLLLEEFDPWRSAQWRTPLVAQAPDGPRIECYGLDTVSFRFLHNVLALGKVSLAQLDLLCEAIEHRGADNGVYRILASHHPVAFPYEPTEVRVAGMVPKMSLRNADRVRDRLLGPVAGCADTLQPYVHLFLSGHTHESYPADKLPDNVEAIYIDGFRPEQMQLVGGSLMQIRDRKRATRDAGLPAQHPDYRYKNNDQFSLRHVCDANQQFQILRFYYRENDRTALNMERLVFVRIPSDPLYRLRRSTCSTTRLRC